ncbi:MAG TPA: lysylphosphatidylglycerol synthase transmembrane domain-containing protein [Solirubrobacteraceae bacterium]|nr:lysylphosphatidylglycerol synthase transmembrane domain-containing protein [Solirubrobacteraceae bacterium]
MAPRSSRGRSARVEPTPIASLGGNGEELPRIHLTRQRAVALGVFVISAVGFLYFVLPKLTGLRQTWDRIGHGSPGWLVVAAIFEALSFGGYVALFRTVFVRGGRSRIDWRSSYLITMAGLAATRLFASAGAGGVALTAWALHRSGMDRRTVVSRMVAFMTVLYAVYMAALVVFGLGLRIGLLPGGGSFALTIVPAIFGGGVIGLALLLALLPSHAERQIEAASRRTGIGAKLRRWLLSLPGLIGGGVRGALEIVRSRDPLALGAVAWWGFDIATLWASFHAFGPAPPFGVIVMAYFIGMLANLLPLPGGIGGVDGGMIGALIAFGVTDSLAVVAVLVYRAFAFWLPTIPGGVAYFQLRRRVHDWSSAAPQPVAPPQPGARVAQSARVD